MFATARGLLRLTALPFSSKAEKTKAAFSFAAFSQEKNQLKASAARFRSAEATSCSRRPGLSDRFHSYNIPSRARNNYGSPSKGLKIEP